VKELIFNIGKNFISGTNTDQISDSFPTEDIKATTLQLKLNGHDITVVSVVMVQVVSIRLVFILLL